MPEETKCPKCGGKGFLQGCHFCGGESSELTTLRAALSKAKDVLEKIRDYPVAFEPMGCLMGIQDIAIATLSEMTSEEINRKIAEACGWVWSMPDECYYRNGSPIGKKIPDYCSDLNAMHEAERLLDGDSGKRFNLWCEYWEHLESLTECRTFDKDIASDCTMMLNAPANIRALAFLKTVAPKL